MSHQVLQAFYIQPGLLDIGAEGVSQHMRCNARNRFAVRLLKLSLHATHIVFQVHCHLRHSGLVQKEKSAATIYQCFYLCGRSGFYYTPQRCTNGICHGNIADTAFCFRRCDKVGLFSRPAKLPPDMDTVPFKVDICSCQAIQLTYTQAGFHKNDDIIIIVAAIVLNELQIFLLLFSGQCITHISVLRHNIRQLELKWILADVVDGHSFCPELVDIGTGIFLVIQNVHLSQFRIHRDGDKTSVARAVTGQKILPIGDIKQHFPTGGIEGDFAVVAAAEGLVRVGQLEAQCFQCLFLLGCHLAVLVFAVEHMTFVDVRCALIQMQCPVQYMNMVAILGFELLDERCVHCWQG